MNAQALQRVIVRMLYDPDLVDAIYAGRFPAEISAAQAGLLRQTPRAAWRTDPYRASRTLQALLEEYSASAALTGLRRLHAFFQDPAFHQAIQQRRYLAVAFGEWLANNAGEVAILELTIAKLRRRRPQRLRPGELVCAENVLPVQLPVGTLAGYQQIRAQLGPRPLETLTAQGFQPVAAPATSAEMEYWLVERTPSGQVTLGGGSSGLNGLLIAAARPVSRATMRAEAQALGAEGDEADTVLDNLIQEGLLRAGETRRGGRDGVDPADVRRADDEGSGADRS